MTLFRNTHILKMVAIAFLYLCSSTYALRFTHGPYLVDQTETEVTIVWFTDVDCHSSVEYGTGGNLSNSVEGLNSGFVAVGRRHQIRIRDLSAGQTYTYRCVSTEVTNLRPYGPTTGSTIRSDNGGFTTLNKNKTNFSFSLTSDFNGDVDRLNTILNLVEWNVTDFMVLNGDILSDISSESSLFSDILDPCTNTFAKTKPLVFVRGEREMRGRLSRQILNYFPTSTNELYYTFSHGPALFFVFDSGENKPDNTPEFSGVSVSEPGRQEQLTWFENYIQTNGSLLSSTPFKIALAHQPNLGFADQTQWNELANDAGIQLLIAGHIGTYNHIEPVNGKYFHSLVVGKDQLCNVSVSDNQLAITILDNNGTQVDAFTVDERTVFIPQATLASVKGPVAWTFKAFRVENGNIKLSQEYKGVKKLVSIYDLSGRLILKTVVKKGTLQVSKNLGTVNRVYVTHIRILP